MPLTAKASTTLSPKTQELWFNFTAYNVRWSMPDKLAYSLNLGPLHLVSFNTETPDDTGSIDAPEVAWLDADLAKANASRAATPWLVAGAHRPLYCTNGGKTDKDCVGFAGVMRGQAEAVLARHGVDLVLGAHMHGYERTQAVLAGKVVTAATNGSTTYVAAGAPVYIVNGAGGNREGNENPSGAEAWSVPGAHTGAIGFGVLSVTFDRMDYAFVVASDGSVFDSAVWLKE